MHRYKCRDKDDSSYVSSILSFQFNIESVYIQVVHHEHSQSAKIQKKDNIDRLVVKALSVNDVTHVYFETFVDIKRDYQAASSFCLYKLKRSVHTHTHTHSHPKVEEEVDWT